LVKKIKLLEKFKKLNFYNTYSRLDNNLEWRINPLFRFILRLCSPCRIGIWIVIFYYYSVPLLESNFCQSNSLICVFVNFVFGLAVPVLIFEFVLAYLAPIEKKEIIENNSQ